MDGVNKEYQLIYKSPLHYTLNSGKIISIVTSISFAWQQFSNKLHGFIPQITEHNVLTLPDMTQVMWTGVILGVLNIVIYAVCHVITIRIYQHNEE